MCWLEIIEQSCCPSKWLLWVQHRFHTAQYNTDMYVLHIYTCIICACTACITRCMVYIHTAPPPGIIKATPFCWVHAGMFACLLACLLVCLSGCLCACLSVCFSVCYCVCLYQAITIPSILNIDLLVLIISCFIPYY